MTMPVQKLKIIVTTITPLRERSNVVRFNLVSVPEQQLAVRTAALLPLQ